MFLFTRSHSAFIVMCIAASSPAFAGATAIWDFVASPNPGEFGNQLFSVDAISSESVWAVGVSTDSLLDKPDTLAMHWDGSAWTTVPTPNPNPALQSNRLWSVSAVSDDDVWAVGNSTFGPNTSPLFIHWDGTEWTQVDVSDTLPTAAIATTVHAIAADDIWAMGSITTGGTGFQTLAAHYDGSSWTPFDVPPSIFGGLEFQAVHGLMSDDVWAAGYENPGDGIFSPLLAHWNGDEWTSLTPPQPGSGGTLHAIAMIAADDVWAVGHSHVVPFGDQPYAIHYDGSSWSVAEMPTFADGHIQLEGLVARASDDVWAAGTNGDESGVPRSLIMHYDGQSWQEVAVSDSGGSHEWFHGMTATPGSEIWAVGQYSGDSGTDTLAAKLSESLSADFDDDGVVAFSDLLVLLAAWGACGNGICSADLDQSGDIGFADLLILLTNWS